MQPNSSMIRRPRRRATPPRVAKLWLLDLEERLTPATFNIPNGDTLGLIAAITASNTDNQPDTINLASVGTYTFTNFAAGETVNALPKVLRDTNNDANTLTINGNGASLIRSSAAGTPAFRFLEIGAAPN